jgi:hypothetical protein
MAEIDKFKEMYKNPLVRFAFTFLEPFPMGVWGSFGVGIDVAKAIEPTKTKDLFV